MTLVTLDILLDKLRGPPTESLELRRETPANTLILLLMISMIGSMLMSLPLLSSTMLSTIGADKDLISQ